MSIFKQSSNKNKEINKGYLDYKIKNTGEIWSDTNLCFIRNKKDFEKVLICD